MEGGSEDSSSSSSYSIPDTESPPYLPPSMLEKRVNWDVFLSFRGEDTRHNFTTFLRDALESKGLRPFMDDKGMERGDTIQPTLDEAVVDSALAVAIISPRYADSRWCLEELSRLFKCRKRVIPVFYGVDPSDVRRQRGELGEGFEKLINDDVKKISEADIEKWRIALNAAGNISGYTCHPQKSDESEDVIRHIVIQVWNELKNTPEYVAKLSVGLDSRVDKAIERLNLDSHGVGFLGIHGTPGIGKTTLAKAVFNKLVVNFKKRSFISNVREQLCTTEGLINVQKKLIRDLSSQTKSFEKVDDDTNRKEIKKIVNETRVLVVLDDVSEANELAKLGIIREWFEEGSRIIITSRNVNALHEFARNDHELYEAEKLDAGESLELFSIHALGRRVPTQEFRGVSEEIVSLTGGLPLALEVFGSTLVKKTRIEWEDALMKLRQIRPSNLQDVLKISYDGLDDQEKTVFLDLSCLLIQMNMKKVDVVDILEGCGLSAELAMGSLVTKSLLKITKDGYQELWMHDQIRDMGRQIVIEECSQDTGKRSRLWDSEDIMHILRHNKVTDAIRGIVLDIKKPPLDSPNKKSYWNNFISNPSISTFILYLKENFKGISQRSSDEYQNSVLQTIWLEKMEHLKLLQINYAKLQGDFKHMSSELRWLQWKGCSHKTFPANLPEQVCVLDLSKSSIDHLWYSHHLSYWRFNKVVGNLVVINLYACPYLTTLPDMSGHRNLKKLTLELCVGLTKIHDSIGNMTSLVHLNLRRCNNLVEFPRDVTGLKSLRDLLLSDCRKIRKLPDDVRSMASLIQLLLDKTTISELPRYLFHLTNLEELSLQGCSQITRLPEDIKSLISLKKLSVSYITNLKELPDCIGSLTNLEELSLYWCSSLTALPNTVGRLVSLTELHLSSSSIKEFPPSIGSLSYLKVLSLGRCRSLDKLPVTVGGLSSIVDLDLTNTPIKSLPDEICSLKFIEKLQMNGCKLLEKLPEQIGKMSNLTMLTVARANLTQLPESIGELDRLTLLNLNNCQRLSSLPDSIGSLSSMRRLLMNDTAVTCFTESFGLLSELRELEMKKSSNKLGRFSELPASFCNLSNLEEFDAQNCGISGQISDDFNKLSKVEILNLGFNDFQSFPVTLEGLTGLQKLLLRHCTELRSLPRLPSTLVELNATDCYELMSINDLSNLIRLQELQLANCSKVADVPGLECLKSLRRLSLGGCNNAIKSAVRRRLSKVNLRNLDNLSVPGSEIPDWFTQTAVTFAAQPNLAIKNVLVALVVSVDTDVLDDTRAHQYPAITDIQACIFRLNKDIFRTTLYLMGVPRTQEDQLYLCRFKAYSPMVSLLKEGDVIKMGWRREIVNEITIKRWGVHLVFENDDDFDGDEDSLSLVENHQSVSQRLVNFFRYLD